MKKIILSILCALSIMTGHTLSSGDHPAEENPVTAAYAHLCANQQSILGYTCAGRIERYEQDGFFDDGKHEGMTKMTKMGSPIQIVDLATEKPVLKFENGHGFVALLQSYRQSCPDTFVEYLVVGDAFGEFKQFDVSYTTHDMKALVTSADDMSQGAHQSLVEQYIAGIDQFLPGKGNFNKYTVSTMQR